MGDYFRNRLFCVFQKNLVQSVSHGDFHRVSMSGLRTDAGDILPFASGFFRGVSDTPFCVCSHCVSGGIWCEPLYTWPENGKGAEMGHGCYHNCYDPVLFVADEDGFSGSPADELLCGEFFCAASGNDKALAGKEPTSAHRRYDCNCIGYMLE